MCFQFRKISSAAHHVRNSLIFHCSAGIYFSGEARAQSVASDVESDPDKASIDGTSRLVTSASPDSCAQPPVDPTDQPPEAPKPRIPKVTSDSFISELVSDREPAKTARENRGAGPAVLEEEAVPGDDEVQAPCAVLFVPGDPQWSNVDLAEVQSQQNQAAAAATDTADTCSLSSVATYTLAIEELYGVDEHPLWAWVSGGGCSVDSHSQLSWFNCALNSSSTSSHCLCYLVVLFRLRLISTLEVDLLRSEFLNVHCPTAKSAPVCLYLLDLTRFRKVRAAANLKGVQCSLRGTQLTQFYSHPLQLWSSPSSP